MHNTIEVHLHKEVLLALRDVSESLRDIHDASESGLVLVESHGKTVIWTKLQAMFGIKHRSCLHRKLHELIVAHAISAEKSGPGGFDQCIVMILDDIDAMLAARPIDEHLSEFGVSIQRGFMPATLPDIDIIVDKYTKNTHTYVKSMLKEAIRLAGFGGRILVEKTPSLTPSVELIDGYAFDVKPAISVTARLDDPRVIAIDGYIESVAEINALLQDASESRQSAIMFVRGAHPDVLSTLKVNFDRGSLRIVPFIVPLEIQGVNTLKDVAIVAGGGVTSTDKGELISGVRLSEQPVINSAIVYPTKVVLSARFTDSIKLHIADLRRRRDEQQVDEMVALFDARIRALLPNHVIVRLPDDVSYVQSAQAIDYTLRAIKALIERGKLPCGTLTATKAAAAAMADKCLTIIRALGAVVCD